MTATGTSAAPVQPVQDSQLDPAFNAGLPADSSRSRGSLSAPTRPTGGTRTSPETGVLEPVLEPVRDDLSVPPVTTEYKVQKGDTLSGIAKKEGITLNDLLAANGLSRSSTIYVGQSLLVPAKAPVAETPSSQPVASGAEVVVAKGDTLSAIASRAGTTINAIKSLNGLSSDVIYVGQRLSLPSASSAPLPSAPSSRSSQSAPPLLGGTTYTVQAGDTPGGIARQFGVSSSQLMAANNISDPRKLRVGQTLVIPGSGSGTNTGSRPVGGSTSSQPVNRTTTSSMPIPDQPEMAAPTAEDPMSVLEALEDEDLPFVEVEVVEEDNNPGN